MLAHPNVWTIPTGAPFLDTLVTGLLDGRLIEGFARDDPFALADLTLYLPTRRAARAVRERFLVQLGRPLLLPRIRALGDIDEDDPSSFEDGSELPPAVSRTERQLVLTGLVLRWSGAMVRAAADLPDEELVVPASPADATRLAASLGRLIDQVGADPDAWRGLLAEFPAELARFWEITLEFLKIATAFWPAYLAEHGMTDPGVRRDFLIRREAERLEAQGSIGPVVAAGSTGSVPATAALLAAIARLPNGAVVLPGLDQTLDEETWREIGPSQREPAGAGHPQHGLKLLLKGLGVSRADVRPLGAASAGLEARTRFVSEAMRPAGTTDQWSAGATSGGADERARALDQVGIVECGNEREEAVAAAVILREAAEHAGKVAALITPDRGLARRVAVELRRWGIEVDDSAGRPLVLTPAGVFARLVAQTALDGAQPETLLALLKHPLARFGLPQTGARRAARSLERAVLRGPRLRPGLDAIRQALHRLIEPSGDGPDGKGERRSEAARRLRPHDWAAAADLIARVQEALRPLEELAATRSVPLRLLVEAHGTALAEATRDEAGNAALGGHEGGDALLTAMEDLRQASDAGPDMPPGDYPDFFAATIEGAAVRRRGGADPRIHIWGALEARLQSLDLVVLGGMNEGTWPSQTRLDPLLSRPMRAALELEPPERRIGLAAHDFAQALGHRTVWLTRADRENGEPRVASRWLQRLAAYAGPELAGAMRGRGAEKLALARLLDAPRRNDAPVRPCPVPPLDRRPTRLSVTRIETLIRDPYAIYASYVLRLKPFEAIAGLPGASDRGSLIHGVLDEFVRERPAGPFDRAAETRLLEIGRAHFDLYADFPEIGTLWWPRFKRIAKWFVATEAEREDIAKRLTERTGSMSPVPGFELTARADRLDRLSDGRIGIVDYKTGAAPGPEEVLTLAPQLPLEALVAREGGFAEIGRAEVARVEYYIVSGRKGGGEVCARGERQKPKGSKPPVTLEETIADTEKRLKELIAFFESPAAGYLSRKIPRVGGDYAGDYDHLARVAEWSLAEGAEEP